MGLHFIHHSSHGDSRASIVMLHGLGADEHDLMGLAPFLGNRYEYFSVRAPIPYSPGYSWFDIGFGEHPSASMLVDCDQARAHLEQILHFIEPLTRPRILLGFSQGAMMAVGMWLEHGAEVDAVVSLSGGWLPCFEQHGPAHGPILMTHGEYDSLLPISFALESHRRLMDAGASIEFHSFAMAHEINEDSLKVVVEWLDRRTPDEV